MPNQRNRSARDVGHRPDPLYRFYGHMSPTEHERTEIRAEVTATKEGNVATIRLYDPIDSWGDIWGVSAKEVAAALDELGKVDTIRLRINSPGGDAFEGIAIYNVLASHPAQIDVIVDGLAASAASLVAMAGDTVTMSPGSQLMVHDSWGICIGNADDMTKMSNELSHMSDNIASVYAERAGGTVEDWRQAMLDETWYSPQEAVKAGLADKVAKKSDSTGDTKARFDLSIFNFAGRSKAPAPLFVTKDETLAVSIPDKQTQEKQSMTPEQLQAINLPEDATDEQITERLSALAKLDEDGGSEGETTEPEPDEDTPDEDDTSEDETPPETETSSVEVPEGSVLVDAQAFKELQIMASQNQKALAKFEADKDAADRDSFLASAMKEGRIAPAQRKHYENMWAKDRKLAQDLINSFPKNTIPVTETGRGDEAEQLEDNISYPTQFLTASEKARIMSLQEA